MKIKISKSSDEMVDALKYFNNNALHSAINQHPNSRAIAVWLSPTDFIKLARPGIDQDKRKAVKNLLNDGIKFDSIPFLGVETDKNGNVVVDGNGSNHEGRHRCRLLNNLEVKLVPVLIQSSAAGEGDCYRWGNTEKRPKKLIGYNGFSIDFPQPIKSFKVSLSSFIIGDKVACKQGINEWYVGRVTTVKRLGGYVVTLNNGMNVTVTEPKNIIKVLRGTAKTSYTTAQVIALTKKRVTLTGTWVIGDVHGCLNTLKSLVQSLNAKHVYTLGDYIDRGPSSKEVLDYLMANRETITALTGNHEQMLLQCLVDPRLVTWWINNGGKATLQSFGVNSPDLIPKKYIDFIKQMPYYKQVDEYVLSHAGADFNRKKPPLQDTEKSNAKLVWNRDVKPPKEKHGVTIVVGHTPTSLEGIQKSATTTKVYVDGGCARGGHLVAFCLETKEIRSMPHKS